MIELDLRLTSDNHVGQQIVRPNRGEVSEPVRDISAADHGNSHFP